MTRSRFLRFAIMLTLAPTLSAWAYPETWVEPYVKDCLGIPKAIHPAGFGTGGSTNSVDLDADGNYDAIGSEDGDSDDIYATIGSALSNTGTGGIIHLGGGHYREALTITDSVTIRGPEDGSAILKGIGGASCGTVLSRVIDVTGTGKTVILENLTIQGCSVQGVRCDASNLRMINCRVQYNVVGVTPPTSAYRFELIDSQVRFNTSDGLNSGETGNWLVAGSSIANNGGDGIDIGGTGVSSVQLLDSRLIGNTGLGLKMVASSNGGTITADGSTVSSNGGTGISLTGRNTGSFRITDSTLESNVGDGLYVENSGGCVTLGTASLPGIVENSRIYGNSSDGIELKESGSCNPPTTTTSRVKASIYLNTISLNGAYGLRSTGCTIDCGLGRNQLAYNVSGVETGGTFCTIATDSKNQ